MFFLATCPGFVICNIPILVGNCCCQGGIPNKRKQWINVSFWSDYIIWLLNDSLFEILELFWISATGISVYIILFEFENLWHKCKFYRWWINHHYVGVYSRGGALQKTIIDPSLTMVLSLWFSFSTCFPRTYEISACTLFSGFHLQLPFITHYEPIQVTLQTD